MPPITPLPPVPNAVKIDVQQTLGDDANCHTIMHANYDAAFAPLSAAAALTLAEAIEEQWEALILVKQSIDLVLDSVTVTDLTTLTGAQAVAPAGEAGSDPSHSVSAAASLVISERTHLRGRSFRGRIYLPGVGNSERDTPQLWNAVFAAAVAANFQTMNTNLIAAGGGVNFQGFIVISYFSGVDHTVVGKRPQPKRRLVPQVTFVNQFIGVTRIGSQRRRNA